MFSSQSNAYALCLYLQELTFNLRAGQNISSWHDIPLYGEAGTVNFVCEIPKESSAKMEVATVSSPAG